MTFARWIGIFRTMKTSLLVSMILLTLSFICKGQRAAFFIGIGNYKILPPLDNCARDADSMKEALHRIGYDTFEIKNASNDEVRAALNQWFPLMSKYRDVVIYFSGHGFMLASNNEFMALDDFNPNTYKDVAKSYRRIMDGPISNMISPRKAIDVAGLLSA